MKLAHRIGRPRASVTGPHARFLLNTRVGEQDGAWSHPRATKRTVQNIAFSCTESPPPPRSPTRAWIGATDNYRRLQRKSTSPDGPLVARPVAPQDPTGR